MQGIVEQVRDGSTVRVYLLTDFQFVQVFVAGIQVCTFFCCPLMVYICFVVSLHINLYVCLLHMSILHTFVNNFMLSLFDIVSFNGKKSHSRHCC